MPRIRKKTSKRSTTNERRKVLRKVRESRKKEGKAAKKNPQWKSKHPKDPGIPNAFPYKDQILAEIAEQRRIVEEEKQRRKEEKRRRKEDKEREDVGGLAMEEVADSEALDESEGAVHTSSRKQARKRDKDLDVRVKPKRKNVSIVDSKANTRPAKGTGQTSVNDSTEGQTVAYDFRQFF